MSQDAGGQGLRSHLLHQGRELPLLVVRAFARHVPPGLEIADLMGVGNFGLCLAAEQFDPWRGTTFRSYAIQIIRGRVLDAIREWDFYSRSYRDRAEADDRDVPAVQSLDGGAKVPMALLTDPSPGPEAIVMAKVEREQLIAAVDRLPSPGREVIRWRFLEGLTHLQIGERLCVSKSRSVQICKAALRTLECDPALRSLTGRDDPDALLDDVDVLCDRPGEV
jgi:RNA polymerase sigma factor for flagellar operon FliA